MKLLGTFAAAREKIVADVAHLLSAVRGLSAKPSTSLNDGISNLRQLRQAVYEDLNQIQHEYMAVCAADWLIENKHVPRDTIWSWNPRQTGKHNEPDLLGQRANEAIVSAEITTSEKPNGVIDTRMRKTLAKLSKMDGKKFYFVRTEAMLQRATTKIKKLNLDIKAQLLPQ